MPSVFLSHSSQDSDLALRLARDLETQQIEVWLDEWEIRVGDSITQRIQHGLENVDYVVVLLTRQSVRSGWVEKEWQSQIGIEAESRRIRILPVKSGDVVVPTLLRDKKYADVTHDYAAALDLLVRSIRGHSEIPRPPDRTRFVTVWAALVASLLLATVVLLALFRNQHVVGPDGFGNPPPPVRPLESYRIRHVALPPRPDYSHFTLIEDKRLIDYRGWKPFDIHSQGRDSPVTWTRHVLLRKVTPADEIRFEFSTEGSGIDPDCVSHDFYVDEGVIATDPLQLLMKSFQVVALVGKEPPNKKFEVVLQATFWNGSLQEGDWTAYKVYAPVERIQMSLLFSPAKRPHDFKVVRYEPGNPQELPILDDPSQTIIWDTSQLTYMWEIRNPTVGDAYEIQWLW